MKVRILIVDDESEIREMLSRHFRYLGYDVETAANGHEALGKMEEVKTDIIITDIMMPMMDGISLLKIIRKSYPLAHTIMISGYGSLANVLACMRYGADTFVFKPLEDLSKLEEAVANAISAIENWLSILQELSVKKNSSQKNNP